jgi:peptidoglycan/xylan/chitin deacetylase (PgdA/CDA1 family)
VPDSPVEHRPPQAALHLRSRGAYIAKHWFDRLRLRRPGHTNHWQGVRLLGYHRVSDEADELAVPPARFQQHLEALLRAGVEPVGIDRACDIVERGEPGRYTTLTFDDGYRDFVDQALPHLERLGVPAVVYVATHIVDSATSFTWYDRQPPVLGWDELAELARHPLVTIGAHTRSHPSLPRLDAADAREEIAGSRRDAEGHLPGAVVHFCYPAGHAGPREYEMVRQAGFRSGVTCEPGVNGPDTPLLALRRTMVPRRDSVADFEARVAGAVDAEPALLRRLRQRESGVPRQ